MKVYESMYAVAVNEHPLSIEDAKRTSHDAVIAGTGRARRSSVMWSFWPTVGAQEAITADGVDIRLDIEVLVACAMYPNGVLVMATVEVDPEVAP